MKIYTKRHSEYILITIGYLENLLKYNPEFNNTLSLNLKPSEKSSILTDYESIKYLKLLMGSVVEMPKMNFTKPLTKWEYLRNAVKTIQNIKQDYLNAINTKLNENEKIDIIKGVKAFYKSGNHRLLFSYSSHNATNEDRIGHYVVTMAFTLVAAYFIKAFLPKSDDSTEVVETVQNEEANLDEFFDAIFDNPELEELLSETHRSKNESIRLIYKELESILPNFTPHRKYIITGYIAEGFGLLSFDDKAEFNNYNSKNHYFEARVKSLVSR